LLVTGITQHATAGIESRELIDLSKYNVEPLTLAELGVDPELEVELDSLSQLYATDTAAYWAGFDDSGDVCLIARHQPNEKDWATIGSCAQGPVFQTRGLWLRIEVVGEGSDVTLIPDGLATRDLEAAINESGGSIPVENLVVFPLDVRPADFVWETVDGNQLDLGAVPRP
jgi:hypothetical protein